MKRLREELEEERRKSKQVAAQTKRLSTLIEACQVDLTSSKREAEIFKKQVLARCCHSNFQMGQTFSDIICVSITVLNAEWRVGEGGRRASTAAPRQRRTRKCRHQVLGCVQGRPSEASNNPSLLLSNRCLHTDVFLCSWSFGNGRLKCRSSSRTKRSWRLRMRACLPHRPAPETVHGRTGSALMQAT